MSTKEIEVEKGIPVPRTQVTMRWPLKEMQVGDSFPIPKGKRGVVAAHASRAGRDTGKMFTVRTIKDEKTGKKEVRCWRVK